MIDDFDFEGRTFDDLTALDKLRAELGAIGDAIPTLADRMLRIQILLAVGRTRIQASKLREAYNWELGREAF